jgi:hypothetical protein
MTNQLPPQTVNCLKTTRNEAIQTQILPDYL